MLDARPRINTLGEVFIPISFDGSKVIYFSMLRQRNGIMRYKDFATFKPCKYVDGEYTLVTDRKLTIDNVEVYVYHTSMGYVVYNETHALLVAHLREVRQYEIT